LAVCYTWAMEDYISLTVAAEYAGYRSKSTLKAAALQGALKTIQPAPNYRMTTRAWVDEYMQSRRAGTYRRGQPRKGQVAGAGRGAPGHHSENPHEE